MRKPNFFRKDTSIAHDAQELRPPNAFLLMLEARAPWELAALVASAPWLRRLPAGDGHPVLVLPGLASSDFSTGPLRAFLRGLGYAAAGWKQGFNLGPRAGVVETCMQRLDWLAERHRQKVSLVGWSLGGVYARELAKEQPDKVRCVITLGSPFAGHPHATNAWRLFEWVSGQSLADNAERIAQLRVPPPVPTTSIYSRSDGVVAWRCSINEETERTENIELHGSHVGMGVNPLVLYAVADRLRQDPAHWQRFDPKGARRWFYKVNHRSPMRSAAQV